LMDEIANAKLKKTVVEDKPPQPANPQGDLMSAIRNADKSRLKPASERQLGELKSAPSTNSKQGQDLMNALVSRMSAIRPSIDGDGEDEDEDEEDWD